MTTHTDAPQDDDADTGMPAALALGAGILLLPLGCVWLCWGVLMGVSR